MRMVDIIEAKRDGAELSARQIKFFIDNYTKGIIPDYQASAFAMAVYFRGMTERECADLTDAMARSGDIIDLSAIDGIKTDKHSTGGVGDKTTLIVAPLAASVGIPVAKMSGRGLGHTGGTIDKLESIPGFQTEIDRTKFIDLVNKYKIALAGQSGNLTPADKKLYALRDVTGTVESLPLIASSIMSKKIASGADAIVLDVKTGSGAFMQNLADAEALAQTMVHIGTRVGRQTTALISDMSQPLGHAVGNALEVIEAIETLKGRGPGDLTELSLELAAQMAFLADKADDITTAKTMLKKALDSGSALAKFRQLVENQGGDTSVINDYSRLPQAKYQTKLPARQSGIISSINAHEIGLCAMLLGAGRATKSDTIDPAVGIVLHKKIGDAVQTGEPLLTIHSNSQNIDDIKNKLYNAIKTGSHADRPRLIYKIITESPMKLDGFPTDEELKNLFYRVEKN